MTINNVLEQYAAPHYDKASISGIAKSDLKLTVSDKVFLDFLLMKIRSRTISYATMKKKTTREKEESLLRDIKLFEEKESKTETDIKHIAEKNKELVSLRKKTMDMYYCDQKRDGWQKEKRYQNTFVTWRKCTMLVNK